MMIFSPSGFKGALAMNDFHDVMFLKHDFQIDFWQYFTIISIQLM